VTQYDNDAPPRTRPAIPEGVSAGAVPLDDALADLPDYVLGTLPATRHDELQAMIAASPGFARELARVRAALTGIADHLPPITPRAGARRALLDALDSGDRFAPFVDDLVRHLDMAKDAVRALLHTIDDATRWELGPMPGIGLMHFSAGPHTVAPDAGFVRMERGLHFPYHRHVGHEINYVLQGAIRDGDGTLYLPGEAIIMAPGTEHEFSVPHEADLLMLVVQAGFDLVQKP
jgi:hypothetical protein